MKLTYKQRLFGFIFILFASFSVCLIISEQREQKMYKTLLLESKLDGYVEAIHGYLLRGNSIDSNLVDMQALVDILPQNIRVTIIKDDGVVTFDNDILNLNSLENHLSRPEILKAQYHGYGSNIRMSSSTSQEYIYYSRLYTPYFIRVALPYTLTTQSLLQVDNWFVYVVLVLFILLLILVNFVASRFGKSITRLRTFTQKIKNDEPLPDDIDFPQDELGDIGQDLIDIFKQKQDSKHQLYMEHKKMVEHFHYAEIGLCLFNKEKRKTLANTYFIQYLNLILDHPTFDVNSIFQNDIFSPINNFIEDKERKENYTFFTIERNGKVFFVQIIIFEDRSFEVTIRDITKLEKNRLLKQEMTNNVAHELRTPVTSLRGYLETLTMQDIPETKRKQFLDRAYSQVIRLSSLIENVSLLSNIEETPARYAMEDVNILQVIDEARIDLADKIEDQSIKLMIDVSREKEVKGNYSLLYSIFRNLIENSIHYAGTGIEIHINNYLEDDDYLYFSYYDTGGGVPKEYLGRLFERFYRIDEGRARNTGGSGLGLSIVKNAIILHKGKIEVRNRENAGLEFLFTLPK